MGAQISSKVAVCIASTRRVDQLRLYLWARTGRALRIEGIDYSDILGQWTAVMPQDPIRNVCPPLLHLPGAQTEDRTSVVMPIQDSGVDTAALASIELRESPSGTRDVSRLPSSDEVAYRGKLRDTILFCLTQHPQWLVRSNILRTTVVSLCRCSEVTRGFAGCRDLVRNTDEYDTAERRRSGIEGSVEQKAGDMHPAGGVAHDEHTIGIADISQISRHPPQGSENIFGASGVGDRGNESVVDDDREDASQSEEGS